MAFNAIHELGHILGMMHEHNRPDRDDYLLINKENIIDKFDKQFNKTTWGFVVKPFDWESVMLYS